MVALHGYIDSEWQLVSASFAPRIIRACVDCLPLISRSSLFHADLSEPPSSGYVAASAAPESLAAYEPPHPHPPPPDPDPQAPISDVCRSDRRGHRGLRLDPSTVGKLPPAARTVVFFCAFCTSWRTRATSPCTAAHAHLHFTEEELKLSEEGEPELPAGCKIMKANKTVRVAQRPAHIFEVRLRPLLTMKETSRLCDKLKKKEIH